MSVDDSSPRGPADPMAHPMEGVDVDAVAAAVRPHLRPTTFLETEALDRATGARVLVVSETFQHTGSFKLRAALGVALHRRGDALLTASSGNFGAALAYAARLANKRCTVVMPETSAQVKIDAVRSLGAEVDLIDVGRVSREDRVAQLAAERPGVEVVSPYDDPYVIAGNATLGAEIFARETPDVVLVPIGGGGISSGVVVGRDRAGVATRIVGAEPLLGNDAARSLRERRIVVNESEPKTLADGARTVSLGVRNFAVLSRGMEDVIEVTEEAIAKAVRLYFEASNLKVEPTGALALGALLASPDRFRGMRVACVVSGGNVDRSVYASLLLA